MSKYISLDNLARYDGKMQEYAESHCAQHNDAMWRQTEKAGAVSFWPVGRSPLEGTVEFMFKETPPASGDKSPSNPSAITGVNSFGLTVCGKNLLPFPYYESTKTVGSLKFTVNADGSITVDGKNDTGSAALFRLTYLNVRLYLKKDVTYRLSGCPEGGSQQTYKIYMSASTPTSAFSAAADTGIGVSVTPNEDCCGIAYIQVNNDVTVNNIVFRPQIEVGSDATEHEAPEFQLTTIDLNGTFYGGSIDLATGVMSVEWESIALTGSEQPSYSAIHDNILEVQYTNLNVLKGHGSLDPNLQNCTHIPFRLRYAHDSEHFYISASNGKIFLWREVSSLENYLSWLTSEYNAGHPVTFVYKYETPYTVQLTPPQIRALAQPDKYVPRLNTVYTDADAVQIVYQKNPVRDKFEKVQAIIAQGGNV